MTQTIKISPRFSFDRKTPSGVEWRGVSYHPPLSNSILLLIAVTFPNYFGRFWAIHKKNDNILPLSE